MVSTIGIVLMLPLGTYKIAMLLSRNATKSGQDTENNHALVASLPLCWLIRKLSAMIKSATHI